MALDSANDFRSPIPIIDDPRWAIVLSRMDNIDLTHREQDHRLREHGEWISGMDQTVKAVMSRISEADASNRAQFSAQTADLTQKLIKITDKLDDVAETQKTWATSWLLIRWGLASLGGFALFLWGVVQFFAEHWKEWFWPLPPTPHG